MTEDDWIEQLIELEDTMPDPADLAARERGNQMWDRIWEIRDYLGGEGPEPRSDWQLTVPDATEEEKVELRARAMEWFCEEMAAMGRDLEAMEAEEADYCSQGTGCNGVIKREVEG